MYSKRRYEAAYRMSVMGSMIFITCSGARLGVLLYYYGRAGVKRQVGPLVMVAMYGTCMIGLDNLNSQLD